MRDCLAKLHDSYTCPSCNHVCNCATCLGKRNISTLDYVNKVLVPQISKQETWLQTNIDHEIVSSMIPSVSDVHVPKLVLKKMPTTTTSAAPRFVKQEHEAERIVNVQAPALHPKRCCSNCYAALSATESCYQHVKERNKFLCANCYAQAPQREYIFKNTACHKCHHVILGTQFKIVSNQTNTVMYSMCDACYHSWDTISSAETYKVQVCVTKYADFDKIQAMSR